MHPAPLHKTPTQTVDQTQVFEKWILQKKPEILYKMTQVGTKTQLKVWNRFVPNRTTIYSLDFWLPGRFYVEYFCLLDQQLVVSAQFLSNENRKKWMKWKISLHWDCQNISQYRKFTTLKAAVVHYQALLRWALRSEVWSCVWIGNTSKSTFLHQQDLESWGSHDHPIFPPLYPRTCKESCFEGLYFSAERNVYLSTFPWIKTCNSLIAFISATSISSKTYSFGSRQSWKWRVERVLRKGIRVVDSRDQANMNLVLVNSCNSSLDLCHYRPARLQQHHAVLHVV